MARRIAPAVPAAARVPAWLRVMGRVRRAQAAPAAEGSVTVGTPDSFYRQRYALCGWARRAVILAALIDCTAFTSESGAQVPEFCGLNLRLSPALQKICDDAGLLPELHKEQPHHGRAAHLNRRLRWRGGRLLMIHALCIGGLSKFDSIPREPLIWNVWVSRPTRTLNPPVIQYRWRNANAGT